MEADLTIARLAATQHGVVTRQQLLTAGVRPHAVDHRLAKGVLAPVHAGVYRLSGTPSTWHQRNAAATLAAGDGAAASHRAAAFLHGLAGIDPRLEVTVTRARAPQPRGVTVHRVGALGRSDIEVRDGIARTRPSATILGLAAVLPVDALERALDDALVRGLVTYEQLRRRLDFAWPELSLAVEADSYRHHSSRADWARDHTRNSAVISLGSRIVPVTRDDLIRHPDHVVATLVRARAA